MLEVRAKEEAWLQGVRCGWWGRNGQGLSGSEV